LWHVGIRHLETVQRPSVDCVMRFMVQLYHKREHRHIRRGMQSPSV
jgi:hypothetical protein